MRRVYLAGPMTGLPEHNYPAFAERPAALRALGYDVVSPAEGADADAPLAWEEWMRRDIKLLLDCEAVACLPGWERSRGATLEVHIARALGMDVLCAHALEPLDAAA
jgi:nucleoside 2-deoxyribosyltransferase